MAAPLYTLCTVRPPCRRAKGCSLRLFPLPAVFSRVQPQMPRRALREGGRGGGRTGPDTAGQGRGRRGETKPSRKQGAELWIVRRLFSLSKGPCSTGKRRARRGRAGQGSPWTAACFGGSDTTALVRLGCNYKYHPNNNIHPHPDLTASRAEAHSLATAP